MQDNVQQCRHWCLSDPDQAQLCASNALPSNCSSQTGHREAQLHEESGPFSRLDGEVFTLLFLFLFTFFFPFQTGMTLFQGFSSLSNLTLLKCWVQPCVPGSILLTVSIEAQVDHTAAVLMPSQLDGAFDAEHRLPPDRQ